MSLSENHESGPVPAPVPSPAAPPAIEAFGALPTTMASPPVTPMPSPVIEPSAPHTAASAAIARVLARAPTPQAMPGVGSTPPLQASASVPAALASASAPSSAPAPAVDDAPGPITLRSRAFFSEAEARGPEKSDELPFPAPPLVPLPKRSTRPAVDHVEMSGGVLVIQRTSMAWIATGAAVALGLVVALLLGLDGASKSEALAKSSAEVASLTTKLADAEAALTKPRMVLVPPTPSAAPTQDDAAVTKPIADAFGAAFKREVARGEAKVIVEGSRVKLVLDGSALFDAKKTSLARRAEGVIDRLSATLKPLPHRVDVVAHTDGAAGRGKSEWGQSAARATIVVRALETSGIAGARLSAVGRGFAEPLGKSAAANRRVEVIVSTR